MAFLLDKAFGACRPQDRAPEPALGDPADSLLLISFPKPDQSVLSLTPFGGKVEMMLRMAGIEFEGVVGDLMNKQHAPKGKLPVLRHGNNTVADSSCIFEYLCATYPDKMKVFAPKDAKTAATQLAVQRMLEEDMYFCILYANWHRDDAFAEIAKSAFTEVPAMMRPVITRLARASLLSAMDGQGIGRHSWEYVQQRLRKEIEAVSALLQGNDFLTGSSPCQADCFLFACLEAALGRHPQVTDPSNPIRIVDCMFSEHSDLVAFHKRLREQYFPDGHTTHWQRHLGKDL